MNIQYQIGNVQVQQLHEFGQHARDAIGFLATAIQLDQSKQLEAVDKLAALDVNLRLWVGVRSIIRATDNNLPENLKDQLEKLSTYVTNKTLALGEAAPSENLIDHFINLNLQISEGLLESGKNSDV